MASAVPAFRATREYPRDVGGPVAEYKPTYYSKPGVCQAWYRVTKCNCQYYTHCKFWAVVNVYNGLKIGLYQNWGNALIVAQLSNSGLVRPNLKRRIR